MKKLRFLPTSFITRLPRKSKTTSPSSLITFEEFEKEGAHLRDEIARLDRILMNFGGQICELERRTDKWQRPKD